jgi:hypothetical protein
MHFTKYPNRGRFIVRRNNMKKALLVIGFVVLALALGGCSSGDEAPEQKYDVLQYIVNAGDFALIQEMFQANATGEDPTEEELSQLERWIIQNTNAQIGTPYRGGTRDEITDILLEITSISRDGIKELFEKTDTIGKYFAIMSLPGGSRDILIIDKI